MQLSGSTDNKKKINHGKNILLYSILSGLAMVTTLLVMTGTPQVDKKQSQEVRIVKLPDNLPMRKPENIHVVKTFINQGPQKVSLNKSPNIVLQEQSSYYQQKQILGGQPNRQYQGAGQELHQQFNNQLQERATTAEEQKLNRQQAYQQSRQLQQQRQQVNILINNARDNLRRYQLSMPSLKEALDIHSELTSLAQKDSRVIRLFQQIVEAYGEFAVLQKDVQNYTEALSIVQQGLELDNKNSILISIEKDIISLISVDVEVTQQLQSTG